MRTELKFFDQMSKLISLGTVFISIPDWKVGKLEVSKRIVLLHIHNHVSCRNCLLKPGIMKAGLWLGDLEWQYNNWKIFELVFFFPLSLALETEGLGEGEIFGEA